MWTDVQVDGQTPYVDERSKVILLNI